MSAASRLMSDDPTSHIYSGHLFDVYHFDHQILLWLLDDHQKLHLLSQTVYPVIYAEGSAQLLKKLIKRLIELDALLEEPQAVFKKRFYSNRLVRVFKITISRPAVLWKIRNKLFALPDQLQIYHSENDIVAGYLREKQLYPLAPIQVKADSHNHILSIQATQNLKNFEYTLPPLRIMKIGLQHSHRLGFARHNPVRIIGKQQEYLLKFEMPAIDFLESINHILVKENPDVIISNYGDQQLFPLLFSMAQKNGKSLLFDRDQRTLTTRAIQRSGKSFLTYGSWIYRAPSYPLFGRWHIDSQNSFTYKETQLLGVIELARICQVPVQRLARASTGSILTQMEENLAVQKNYLIPWQKSTLEREKSWLTLHAHDKGGLVFKPDVRSGFVQENIFQLDFSQMYPSLMHLYNISPETINCICCEGVQGAAACGAAECGGCGGCGEAVPQRAAVPEGAAVPQRAAEEGAGKQKKLACRVPYLNYRICQLRRGLVSDTLQHVLERRAYYKEKLARASGFEREWTQIKIDSLKWINVVSFGYLGFRNAKFGQLESHESVTAFGRQKLVQAMRIVERYGYQVIHGITDCLFIHRLTNPEAIDSQRIQNVQKVCARITHWTKVKMDIEAIFDWIVFLPSKEDSKISVSNKYFGRLHTAKNQKERLKCRGIFCRRKDMPRFIRQSQRSLLQIMQQGKNIREVKSLLPKMHDCYENLDTQLSQFCATSPDVASQPRVAPSLPQIAPQSQTSPPPSSCEICWQDLLLRKTVGRKLEEYKVMNATSLALAQLKKKRIVVQCGEKIRYLVIDQKNASPEKRYLVEELAVLRPPEFYDVIFYRSLLWQAYCEIYCLFAPKDYFAQIKANLSGDLFSAPAFLF